MALIKCPECGRGISSMADCCPMCGCQMNKGEPRELPPEERPQMFDCYKCGRPIPVGTRECIYCGYRYGSFQNRQDMYANHTSKTGQYATAFEGLFGNKSKLDKLEEKKIKEEIKLVKEQRKQMNSVAKCPKCGSTSLSANKKGFGIGKAVIGAYAIGSIGLTAGNIGARKVWVTCLRCGKRFKM